MTSPSNEIQSSGSDPSISATRTAWVTLALCVGLAVALLILVYAPAIRHDASLSQPTAASAWLELHIWLLVMAEALLISALITLVIARRRGTTPPTLAVVSLLLAPVLGMTGIVAGVQFGNVLWGYVSLMGDAKLRYATLAWTALLIGVPPVILYAKSRLDLMARTTAIAVIAGIGVIITLGSLVVGQVTRTLHPAPLLFGIL
jgi:hypothetical protein